MNPPSKPSKPSWIVVVVLAAIVVAGVAVAIMKPCQGEAEPVPAPAEP